jgi:manganese-dependent inorganic pyrophosphatase
MLTSPTTTERDHKAAERLGRWSFVRGAPLEDETFKTYGEKVLQAGAGLSSREPKDIITADFKLYDTSGLNFGVSQVEVVNRSQVQEYIPDLKQALIEVRDSKGLDFVVMMITDVVRSDSYLLLSDEIPALEDLPYPRRADGTRSAEGVVSRKKQLLPMLLGALEG